MFSKGVHPYLIAKMEISEVPSMTKPPLQRRGLKLAQKGLPWFNPSQQLSTMQPLPPPHSQWDGEEDWKKKGKTYGLR